MKNLSSKLNSTIMHMVLIFYTLICLFPVYLLVNNSFKSTSMFSLFSLGLKFNSS